jgi:preprotein translocase subunit SecE
VSDSASATSSGDTPKRASDDRGRRGFVARIVLFVRQVVAELKKVVRPTRQELFTYIAVVVVFVLVVMAFVGVLDLGFGRLVLWMFG